MKFSHLHLHTEYSLLDGAIRISDLLNKVKSQGMEAVAITDHGVMYGVVDFYAQAKKAGIKPIIGCEVYVAPGSRFEKTVVRGAESAYHLVLLAENQEGYRNLVQLVSKAFLEGFYYKPRIDKVLLQEHHQGLIGLSACLAGEIPSLIVAGEREKAEKIALEYAEILGKDNFFLEIQENKIPEQKIVNQALLEIGNKYGIQLVATNDCHYLEAEDASVHDVLLAIQTATTLDDPKRLRFPTNEFYLKSPEEMERDFSYCPQALENTSLIAERCQVNLELGKVNLPDFPVPPGFDAPGYLRSLCLEGLVKRYGDPPPERARKQLEYELKVIEEMGYSTYFLIVWDFVNFARRKGIMVGPGRGSAAGSIVSYALGITSIDPLQYGLLFERFLNPERVSMPDIDIDFCFERRGEVIEYVAEKYGKTNVAQIITFGRMMARQAVRDVGRALGWSYGEVDKIAKLIPGGPGVTLKKALESNSQLRDLAKQNKELQRLLEIASRIEGMCRHASVHAAGVVISNQPLTNYVPLQKMSEGEVVTQLEMDALQELGLLKMDFLGLRTLTVIEKALQIIKNTHHEEIDLDKIPLNDEETFSLLSRGETTGVFQLESGGMKELLKRLNPSNIEDLTAILALYRPGPLGSGMIEDFINRKHGKVKIEYPHPALEPILRETYGVIVYQEQVMRIAAELAGFTLGEADILRRAMGKKQPEVMKEQRTKFVEGALRRGCSKEKAEEIFDLIEYFAGYGFNKSHSAAYALISYQTAYLKAHYPTEYLAACLTSVANDNEKVAKFIGECKKLGIQVLLPDINESLANFTVVGKNKIRFGLSAIKNVGSSAVEEILTRRKEGKFSNIFDFVERVDSRVINKRVLESLVEAGAFDELHPNRAQLLASLEDISLLSRRKKSKKKQKSLFGEENNNGENFSLREAEELPREELLRMEKEMLGLYISDNPLNVGFASSVATVPLGQISNLKQEVKVRIRGIVNKSKKITTKNGGDMYFVTLEDETGSVEVVFFPKLAQRLEEHLSRKQVIWIIGKVDLQDNGEYKIIAEELIDIEEKKNLSTVHIEIPEEKDTLKTVYFLKDYLRRFPGSFPVVLHLRGEKESWAVELGESFCIDWNEKVENLIKDSLEGGEVWLAG